MNNERFVGEIWGSACGNGCMSKVLKQLDNPVYSSDLYNRGYGDTGIDFLTSTRRVDNITTNPPFNKAEEFIHTSLRLCVYKTAMLLRLEFLEGSKRWITLYKDYSPTKIWVFSKRVAFSPQIVKRKSLEPPRMLGLFGV